MRKRMLICLACFCCLSSASAQWIEQQSNFPEGICAFVISPVNEEVAWASGAQYLSSAPPQNWFCRTVTGGDIWVAGQIPIPSDHGVVNISAISADIAWVAVTAQTPTDKAGVYKTIDGGQTWVQQTNGISPVATFFNFVYFFDANDGLAVFDQDSSGYCPIYYTRNGGDSWLRVADPDNVPMLPGEYALISNYCVSGDTFIWGGYGPSTGRIFTSTDRGKSWRVAQTEFSTANYYAVGPSYKDAMHGLVIGYDQNGENVLVVTQDGGSTWRRTPLPGLTSLLTNAFIPGTEAGYMVTGSGSTFTLDNGSTWTMIDQVTYNLPAFASRETGWAGGSTNTKIFKWHIGQMPAIGSYPLTNLQFNPVQASSSSEPQTLSITNYGRDPLVITDIVLPSPNFTPGEISSLPRTLNSLESMRLNISFTPTGAADVIDSVVIVSNAANSPRHAIKLAGEGIVIEQTPSDLFYAVSAKNLYLVDPTNGSASLIAGLVDVNLNSLTIDPVKRELIGINTSNGKTDLYRISAQSGKTLPFLSVKVGPIRAIAFKADTLYGASMAGGFYRINPSTGETILIGTAPGIKYYGLALHPTTGAFYASASGAAKDLIVTINPANGDTTLVGMTGDNALTPALAFSPAGTLYGFKGTTKVDIITIDPATGKGTQIGGTGVASIQGLVWAPKVTSVDQYPTPGSEPSGFTLLQNYPNPFNSQSNLEYTIPQDGVVEIDIVNLHGESVARLFQGYRQTGRHRVVWTGNDAAGRPVPSGLYFIRITADKQVKTGKMLLLR